MLKIYTIICLCCFLQTLVSLAFMQWTISHSAQIQKSVLLKIVTILSLLIIWPVIVASKLVDLSPSENHDETPLT